MHEEYLFTASERRKSVEETRDFNARPSPLPFQSDARTAAAVAAAAKLDRLDSNKEFIGPDDL